MEKIFTTLDLTIVSWIGQQNARDTHEKQVSQISSNFKTFTFKKIKRIKRRPTE